MPAPTATEVITYLGPDTSWTEDQIASAFGAEKAAQGSVCAVPADGDDWPDDLAEALARRVAHNLALRSLPLGLQSSVAEAAVATTRVGGTDAEVRRLEAPYRKRKVG